MYLASFRAKICPKCGIWPVGPNKNAKSDYNTMLHLVLDLFSLPEGLHFLFQLSLNLFQVTKDISMAEGSNSLLGLVDVTVPIFFWYIPDRR